MGQLFSKSSVPKEDRRILILGLPSSGKTTFLYQLKLGKDTNPISTVGFNMESVKHKGVELTFWDGGGPYQTQAIWTVFLCKDPGTLGVIYVVDSTDRIHLKEAAKDVHYIRDQPGLKDSWLLVLANKRDEANIMSIDEITSGLALDKFDRASWAVKEICATKGEGLQEVLDWVVERIRP